MKRRTFFPWACGVLVAAYGGGAAATDLPALIATAKRSLVLVGTFDETDSPRFQFRGTGFVVGDGHLAITNAHVLPAPNDVDPNGMRDVVVQVRDTNGQWARRAVSVLSVDRPHDLVLLRFEGEAAPALSLDAGGIASEGTQIVLMGFPLGGALGFSPVTHQGIVSSIAPIALPTPSADGLNARAVRQLREGSFDILQLDAVCYPGNSGGPVINSATGSVVGVVNMVLVKGSRESALSAPTGISYAIPVSYVSALLAR